MMKREQRIEGFVAAIWEWYEENKRELPWRDLAIAEDRERAYQVLVSEIMLQQTQVSRVKIVFKSFLERFPTLADLARASNKEVILAWRGMGYNSRALRLRDAARMIASRSVTESLRHSVGADSATQRHSDSVTFPKQMDELGAIPGIGHYTAAAIRNFAFNIPTPCIDTNIRRILHRTFVGPEQGDSWSMHDRDLLKIAREVLDAAVDGIPDHDARNWHAALMDYGSLVQTKSNPRWDLCVLTKKKLMKSTPQRWQAANKNPKTINKKQEPGRFVGSSYIPNRIFRGKVVEELRDAPSGLTLASLGKRVCIDWAPDDHAQWLRGIVEKLRQDRLIAQKGSRFVLME